MMARHNFFGPIAAISLTIMVGGIAQAAVRVDVAADRIAIEKTQKGLHDAFADGDVGAIMAYHHPDVIKALAFDRTLVGRDAVAADLTGTLKAFRLEFVSNEVESLLIVGDLAVEQSRVEIHGTPRGAGAPFVFKARAQVVYQRYAGSPSGWANIREVIQPSP